MNSIDIDVGGTFTDLVLNFDGKALIKKVPTTPYDLSVCFSRVIEEGASAVGKKMDELLPAIDMIRYSTTIAMNRLIERKGPRLALITTEGHEDVVLIGRGAQWIDGTRVQERRNLAIQNKPDPLIPRDMIVGVKERVDSRGNIIRPVDENDVREKVRYLVNRGARGFVVSFLWGFLNPIHERRVKEIIRDEYKEFHIGYLPVVLAGQVVGKLGEYERTMAAILDAYLAALDANRTFRHVGQAARARLQQTAAHDSKLRRNRRSLPHHRQPHLQQRPSFRPDGRASRRQIARLSKCRDDRHGRHQFRRRPGRERQRPQLRFPPHHRSLDGRHHDDQDAFHRRGRRLDRFRQ